LVTVSTLEYLITHLLPSGCKVAWLKSTPPGVELPDLVELDLEVDPDVLAKLDTMEGLSEEEPDELLKEGLGVTKGSGFGEKDDPEEEDDTNEDSDEKDEDDKSMTGEEGDP